MTTFSLATAGIAFLLALATSSGLRSPGAGPRPLTSQEIRLGACSFSPAIWMTS